MCGYICEMLRKLILEFNITGYPVDIAISDVTEFNLMADYFDCVSDKCINWCKKRSLFFCTLSLILRIFTIIYNVLQHYYEEWCCPEGWILLLVSPLAKNNRGACAPRQSVEKHNNNSFQKTRY